MRSMRVCILLVWGLCLFTAAAEAETYELVSPGKILRVKIDVRDRIFYSVFLGPRQILLPSSLSLSTREHGKLGVNPMIENVERRSREDLIRPVVPEKNARIPDVFNEITLSFAGLFSVVFRAYDDGIAYRFKTALDGSIDVIDEDAVFRFSGEPKAYFPSEESFFTHQERRYAYTPLNRITKYEMAYPPVLIELPDEAWVAITEADLEDYPGLYLKGTGGSSLEAIFPAVATRERQTSDRDVLVTHRAGYIARTSGTRAFPWRVLIIASRETDLVESQMVFKLAKPLQIDDPSWIRPGKVAWDWWNANNLFGVNFRAGINTATYKYYIDFAARNGIEYVILDEGWYALGNLFRVNPEIDLPELSRYARERGVGIILWVVWKTLADRLPEALDRFAEWGIKGIKVDFMQRDDQWMVNFYHKVAREAAKRRLLVDFHGAYKPTGLRRAYPNVLTREGVLGLEHNKWSSDVTPEHDVILPFTRMLAGPMDFTPGAMVNTQQKNFRPVFERPVSQGTRCHQLAMYVVYESPLQMMADSPSRYLKEKECLAFLSAVPTVWDETRVLAAGVADFILIARRSGDTWYVGAMTDWSPRELEVDFGFLEEGTYRMEVFRDGVNADRYGNDYVKESAPVTRTEKKKIRLAPGGGWVARLWKEEG